MLAVTNGLQLRMCFHDDFPQLVDNTQRVYNTLTLLFRSIHKQAPQDDLAMVEKTTATSALRPALQRKDFNTTTGL